MSSGGTNRQFPPVTVVVFTGGAVIEPDCAEFVARLEKHPDVDVAGVYCEARRPGFAGVLQDLWRRRRWLAPLLLSQRVLRAGGRALLSPAETWARRAALHGLGDRLHFVADLHAESVLARIRALEPDLGAVYGGPILRPELFDIPRRGCIGIHHGLLPRYRGKKTTFWAMYHGEPSVGVAIQRIGSGLDRGDVLCDATVRTGRWPLPVVVRRLERVGLDLFVDAVLQQRRGDSAGKPQPPGDYPLCRDPGTREILRYWLRYLATLFGLNVRRGRS